MVGIYIWLLHLINEFNRMIFVSVTHRLHGKNFSKFKRFNAYGFHQGNASASVDVLVESEFKMEAFFKQSLNPFPCDSKFE